MPLNQERRPCVPNYKLNSCQMLVETCTYGELLIKQRCCSLLLLLAAGVSGGVRVFPEDLRPAFRFGGLQGGRESRACETRIIAQATYVHTYH